MGTFVFMLEQNASVALEAATFYIGINAEFDWLPKLFRSFMWHDSRMFPSSNNFQFDVMELNHKLWNNWKHLERNICKVALGCKQKNSEKIKSALGPLGSCESAIDFQSLAYWSFLWSLGFRFIISQSKWGESSFWCDVSLEFLYNLCCAGGALCRCVLQNSARSQPFKWNSRQNKASLVREGGWN